MKKILFTLMILISFSAFAGGSIFHHKSRSRNANGVDSIGAYVCGSLQCHDVDIKEGSCDGIEHATMQYGVCTCDDGYIYDKTKKQCLENEEVLPSQITQEEFEEYMDYLNINLAPVSPLKSTTEYEKSDSYKDLVDILAEVKKIADDAKVLKDDLTEENKAKLKSLYEKWKEKNYPQKILNLLGLNGIIKISQDIKVSRNVLPNSFINELFGSKMAYAGLVGDTVSICTGQKCTEVSACMLGMTLASYIPVPGLEKLECLQISSLVDKVISETAIALDWDIVITVNDYPNELYQQVKAKLVDWTKSEVLEKYLPSGRRCCFSNEIKNEKGTCQRCPEGQVSLDDKQCCYGIAENSIDGKICCGSNEEVSEYDSGNWWLIYGNAQSRCCPKGWYATRLNSSSQASCCEKGTTLIYDTIEKCCQNNQIAEADGNKKCCSSSQVILTSKNGGTHCCSSGSVAVKNDGTCCSSDDRDCICLADPDQKICRLCPAELKPKGVCEYECKKDGFGVDNWTKKDEECCENNDECSYLDRIPDYSKHYCNSNHVCQLCPEPKESCSVKKDVKDENGCLIKKVITCSGSKICGAESDECECPNGGKESITDPEYCCKNNLLWGQNTQDYTITSPLCSSCPISKYNNKAGVMSNDGSYCCLDQTSEGWSYSNVTNDYDIATPKCGSCPTIDGIKGRPDKTNRLCCGSNNRVASHDRSYSLASIETCGCPDGGDFGTDKKTCCKDHKAWNGTSYAGEHKACQSECSGDDCCSDISKPGFGCTYQCQKDGDEYKWVKTDSACCENDTQCSGTKPYCDNNKCVECAHSGHCPDGAQCTESRICECEDPYYSEYCCEAMGGTWCGKQCITSAMKKSSNSWFCCPNGRADYKTVNACGQAHASVCCSDDRPANNGNYESFCNPDTGTWSFSCCVWKGTTFEEYC